MNRLEVAVGRVIEMATLDMIHDQNCFGKPIVPPKKMDVVFIPTFHKGKTKWVADIIANGELRGYTEIIFADGMEENWPDKPEDAVEWLKEYFDLQFNDNWITTPVRLREPLPPGYTTEDVMRLTAPLPRDVPVVSQKPRPCTTFSRSC